MARMSAAQLANHFLKQGVGLNDQIPEGPHQGKTVRQLIQERQAQEQQYAEFSGGGMTLDEALAQALNSPDPKSFRVPYGQFQGMGVEQLVGAKKQQQEYLREVGLLPKEQEGPGWQDYAMAFGMPVAQALALDYGRSLTSGAGAATQAGAAASSGGSSGGGLLGGLFGTGAAGTAATQAGSLAPAAASAPAVAAPVYGAGAASGAGAGLGTVGGAGASSAGAGTAGAGAGAGGWGSTLGAALPWLGVAGMGAYWGSQLKDGYEELGDSSTSGQGAYRTLAMTNPLTAWMPAVTDALGISIKSGKDRDQLERDDMRDYFRENTKLYNPEVESQIQLADGSYWDTRSNSEARNIDWDNVNNQAVGALDPLMYALLGPDVGDKKGWMVGEFYNAATSGGDPMQNIKKMYENAGMSRDQIYQDIANDQTLDQGTRNAWLAAIDSLYDVENPNAAKTEAKAPAAPGVDSKTAEAALLPAMKDPLVSPNKVGDKKVSAVSAVEDPLLAAVAPSTPQVLPQYASLGFKPEATKPKAGSFRSSRFWGG